MSKRTMTWMLSNLTIELKVCFLDSVSHRLYNITLAFTAKIISRTYNLLYITGNSSMEAECSSLKQKQENKKKMQKYKVKYSCYA